MQRGILCVLFAELLKPIALLCIVFLGMIFLCASPAIAQRNEILEAYILQNKDVISFRSELTKKSLVLVEACAESLQLSESQKQRLALACKGDVSRAMQEIAEVDVHTRDLKMQNMNGNQDEWQRIWPVVMPVRQRIEEGLHSKGSLFEKSLMSILSPEQLKQFELSEKTKQERLFVALAKLTLVEFEKTVPLTKTQREGIMELVKEAHKPKSVTDGMNYYIGMIVLAKLPEKKVREILSDEQYKLFNKTFKNAANFGGIEW